MGLRLAKAGYYQGDPNKVLSAPVNVVIGIIEYEAFVSDYERTYTELNKTGAES